MKDRRNNHHGAWKLLAAAVAVLGLASCGGNDDDSRNAAIFPGNNFEIAVDHPYQMQSGPEPRDTDVSVESVGQRFTSNPGRTTITSITVRVSRTGTSVSGPRDIEFALHSSANGLPGTRLARLGSVTVDEGYEGMATVGTSPSPALAASTEYFVVATAGPGDGPVSVQTALNIPMSNVDPAPEFVSYLGSVGSSGPWLPNETGRNMILTVSVEQQGQDSGTTTTVGDATGPTDTVAGEQVAVSSTVSPSGSVPAATSSVTSVNGDGAPVVDPPTTTVDPASGTPPTPSVTVATTVPGESEDSIPGDGAGATGDTVAPNDSAPASTVTDTSPAPSGSDAPTEIGAAYSPADDPATTRDLSVTLAAFAALSAAGAAAALGGAAGTAGGDGSAGRLSTLATKRLKLRTTSRAGAGDSGSLWRRRGTERIDATFRRIPASMGQYSSVAPRILVDGSWARAMFGSVYMVLWSLAAAAGVLWALDTRGNIGLPAAWLLVAVLLLGTLDSLSGAVVALSFTVLSAVSGDIGDWAGVRTMLGMWVVLLSPALIGNVVRPLRRVVHGSDVALRERVLDYVMGPVGTMFAVSALVQVLNGLSGTVIADDGDVRLTKWTVLAAMTVRLALEDRAVHSYPERLRAVQPAEMPAQSAPWAVLGAATRFALYLFVSAPYFGVGAATVASAVLLTAPFAIKPVEGSLPDSAAVSRWLPRGFLRFAVLVLVGGWLGAALLGDSPTADTVRSVTPWLFVPSAVLGILDSFGRSVVPWPDTRVKRWGGAALWVVVVLVLAGVIDPF
ncbi:MAG: hypothetical protein ACKOFF_09065 [Acidimicrobiales bacterium]